MRAVLNNFALAALIGGTFAIFKMPIPAPSNAAGIAGVVGLFVGSIIVTLVMERWL